MNTAMTPHDFMACEMEQPFEWGLTDCCSIVDRWVFLRRGYSPRVRAGMDYTDEASARAWIDACHGGIAGAIIRVMRANCFDQTETPQDGDVGLALAIRDDVAFAGVLVDGIWIGRDTSGWLASAKYLRAWRVG